MTHRQNTDPESDKRKAEKSRREVHKQDEDEEREDRYGGILPDRDLKKNLGCGG